MFAVDAKMLKRIERMNRCRDLQIDLDKLYQWRERGLRKFNVSKSKIMKVVKGKYRPDFEYMTGWS